MIVFLVGLTKANKMIQVGTSGWGGEILWGENSGCGRG